MWSFPSGGLEPGVVSFPFDGLEPGVVWRGHFPFALYNQRFKSKSPSGDLGYPPNKEPAEGCPEKENGLPNTLV